MPILFHPLIIAVLYEESVKSLMHANCNVSKTLQLVSFSVRLTKATQTCQQGLDKVLKHCKDCVDNYVNDCIVFGPSCLASS